MDDLEKMRQILEHCEQSQLLKYWHQLNQQQQAKFLEHLKSIDFIRHFRTWQTTHDDIALRQLRISRNLYEPLEPQVEKDVPHNLIDAYRSIGLEEIANGRVAVLVLAGGTGTRLGLSFPKGMCPTGLPSGKTMFQLQAERIRRLMTIAHKATGKKGTIYWYIMTSDVTHMLTEKFLAQNNYFGLDKNSVVLFRQDSYPLFNLEGQMLLEEPDRVWLVPDGNGGIFKALVKRGVLHDMEQKGIKYVHAHSVDNMLIKVADPVFIGKCVKDEVDCGLKVVEKTDPTEPLGLVVTIEKQPNVIEYTEMPRSTAAARTASGKLVLSNGNICNHLFHIDFLKNVCLHHERDLRLHTTEKFVEDWETEDDRDEDASNPNSMQIEKFIFDAIEFSKKLLVWQVERFQEFSPVKNCDDAGKDCFKTARRDLLALHKSWVELMGGKCEGEGVEVSPLLSYGGENLVMIVKGREFKQNEVLSSEEESSDNLFRLRRK